MSGLLEVRGVHKSYGPAVPQAVRDATFDVERGEIFALLGPSGCGKTTTLRLVAGFERADAGEILLDGRLIASPTVHMPPERRSIGVVFQDYALFPHLDVAGNVGFGLVRESREARERRVAELLDIVGLGGLGARMPAELSGGQQQRVALARALAPRPQILLLDEPFSNLDTGLRVTMREEVRGVLNATGTTAVLVTHDQGEALSFADRLGVMHAGHVEQTGEPRAVYLRPRTPFVAQFLGRANLVRATARGTVADTPLGEVSVDREATGDVILAIRPEHIRLEVAENGAPAAEVVSRAFHGHDLTLRVRVERHEYVVYTDFRCPFGPGERVRPSVSEPAVVLDVPEARGR